jgi:hypothetical protein
MTGWAGQVCEEEVGAVLRCRLRIVVEAERERQRGCETRFGILTTRSVGKGVGEVVCAAEVVDQSLRRGCVSLVRIWMRPCQRVDDEKARVEEGRHGV